MTKHSSLIEVKNEECIIKIESYNDKYADMFTIEIIKKLNDIFGNSWDLIDVTKYDDVAVYNIKRVKK